ncbi:MobA/MobL protein, partial [human gut metagenome]
MDFLLVQFHFTTRHNKLFKEKGLKIRVDHRSYERQDVNRVP